MAYNNKWKTLDVINACTAALSHHTQGEEKSRHYKELHRREKEKANVLRNKAVKNAGEDMSLEQHEAEWVDEWS